MESEEGRDERSTALTDWAVRLAQGVVIIGLVIIGMLIMYGIVAVGQ